MRKDWEAILTRIFILLGILFFVMMVPYFFFRGSSGSTITTYP